MDRRDLVLYWIEMSGQVVTRIVRLLTGGGRAAAGQALQDGARQLGVDLDLARSLDGESLLGLLAPGGRADPTRCMLFGEMLYVDGLMQGDAGDPEAAFTSFAKARLLLECAASYGSSIGVRYPDIDARVREIATRLESPAAESGS